MKVGDKVRLRTTSRHHAQTFGMAPDEVVEVAAINDLGGAGQAPGAHLQLRLASGVISPNFARHHFQIAPAAPIDEGKRPDELGASNDG